MAWSPSDDSVLSSDGAGALTVASITASGDLGTATVTATGNASVGGTLAVTGASTLTGAVTLVGALQINVFELSISFGDLGSGASSAHALTGFPTNVWVLGAVVEVTTPFAGEGDLAVTIGDTADPDGKMGSVSLDGLAAGIYGAVGAEQGFMYEADFLTAGADATFTATELDDVSAGVLTVRVYYATDV